MQLPTKVMKNLRMLFRSRYFIASATIITFAVLLVNVIQPAASSFNYSNKGYIPRFQTSAYAGASSSGGFDIYSQFFNQYGTGISGARVYYNVTDTYYSPTSLNGNSLKNVIIESTGFAGTTGANGFLKYNISTLPANGVYNLTAHVFNRTAGYSSNYSLPVSTGSYPPQLSNSQLASITPVLDKSVPSKFSLHVWRPYMNGTSRLSIKYSIPYATHFSYYANQNGHSPVILHSVTGFTTQAEVNVSLNSYANVPTSIKATGNPYWYAADAVEIGNNTGEVGAVTFTTLKDPAVQAADEFGQAAGILSLLLMAWSVNTVFLVSDIDGRVKGKPSFFNRMIPQADRGSRDSVLAERILLNVLASIPILAAPMAVTGIMSYRHYGALPAADAFIFLALGNFLIAAVSSSLASIGVDSGLRDIIAFKNESSTADNAKRAVMIASVTVVSFAYILLNISSSSAGAFIPKASSLPSVAIVANMANPFAYVFLLSQLLTGSLFSFQQYSYTASFVPPNAFLVGGLGGAWAAVTIALPYLYYRMASRESSAGRA